MWFTSLTLSVHLLLLHSLVFSLIEQDNHFLHNLVEAP